MGFQKPQYSVSTSVAIRKGKYVKGPSFGLWLNDKGGFPMARGSVKENYLDELIEFLQKCQKRELSASFALFKNDKQKSRDSDDDGDGEWSSKKSKDSDDDFDMPKKKSKREEPEEEDEKSSKKSSSKSPKSSGKEGKKSGSDWDFNDDD